ncbi:hypothetical protein PENTCL1PPCAC_12862 [Pristionchus entomophagus]|uniref:Fascin domain-containing protein n=1 Tax=Pristionchus entomophagus TaxID=358040 RepID=A0AAV5T527_9BILA|nr:hypothetical protein PENTCL1PPCAC_12862 [Pristionchus entomophagus]
MFFFLAVDDSAEIIPNEEYESTKTKSITGAIFSEIAPSTQIVPPTRMTQKSKGGPAVFGEKQRIVGVGGLFVRVHNVGGRWIVDTSLTSGDDERFHFQDHDDMIVFKTVHGAYLCATGEGEVSIADEIGPRSKWSAYETEEYSWSFKSHQGWWLSIDTTNGIVCTKPSNSESERFICHYWEMPSV